MPVPVKTGMTPPPMPGMPAPMQPMGGMPPAQNPFAPMPPMPLAGSPPPPMPPMAQGQMPQGQQQQMMGSTAGRRRRFGDALEGMLGRNQGIGAAMPQQQRRPMPMPQMMPRQQMVAPGTPMMRTPSPRPMAMGGEVDIFGYEGGGPVQYYKDAGVVMKDIEYDAVAGGNESLGNDMVMMTFADGSKRMTQKALYEAAKDLGALDNMQSGKDFADWHLNEWAGKVISDPDYVAAHDKFNTNQIAYNQALMDEHPEIAKNRLAFVQQHAGNNPAAMAAAQELYDKYYGEKKDTGVDQTYGSDAGAGTAVDASGGMGAGSYDASGYDQSGVTNFANFSGQIGSALGGYSEGQRTPEMGALFGPNVGFAQTVSQYYTDPVTGGLTTTAGPEMSSVSPIGGALLPARPVDLDVFDFLSTPTYGTMYSRDPYSIDPAEMAMGGEVSSPFGGSVPRNTMIGDQPHMLAYINPQEANLLKDLGGSGEPGPGGIPAYRNLDADLGVGAINSGKTYSGSDKTVSGSLGPGGRSGHATDDDDKPSRSSTGPSGYTSLDAIAASNAAAAAAVQDDDNNNYYEPPGFDFDDDGITGEGSAVLDNNTTNPFVDIDDDPVTPVTPTPDSSDDIYVGSPSSETDFSQPVVTPDPVYTPPPSPPPPPPPVYTDRRGNQYGSQAEADAADRAFASQLASYGSGKVGFDRFADQVSKPYIPREESDRAASRIYTDKFRPELAQYTGPDILGGIYTGIGGIGAGPESGSLGITPAPITSPDISIDVSRPDVGPAGPSDIETDLFGTGLGSDILSLETPSAATMYPYDVPASVLAAQLRGGPLTPGMDLPDAGDIKPYDFAASTISADQPLTDDDMGLPSGPVSDIDRGLGGADRQTYYGGSGPRDERDMYQAPAESVIAKTIAGFEGRTETPYWDVNANRAGYGSDTKTDPVTGEVTKITSDTTVSKAEADADLNRRLTTEFIPRLVNTVGADTFYGMNPEQQAALTSITYNYGKLPDRVASVVNNVDPSTAEGQKAISDAIRSLEGDNDGVNRNRRNAEADLFLGQGDVPETSVVTKSDTGVSPEKRDENVEKIKKQIGDQAEPTGVEAFFYDVIGQLGFGLGKGLADDLRGKSREERQSIIDQHLYALQNGATPKTDEEGNYIGFDISTMDTFADKVLGAEDIGAFLPPSMAGGTFTVTQDMIDQLRATAAGLTGEYINPEIAAALNAQADALTVGQTLNLPTTTNTSYQADADGDGVPDYVRFGQVYDAQATAAAEDPYGMSTEQGFITSDGKEFFVDATGKVVEVTDGTVPLEVGGGEDVAAALGVTETTDGGDDDAATAGPDTGHVDGVCNTEGYVYNPETDMCEPPKEEDTDGDLGSPITTGITPRSFDDVLKSVVVPAPRIAPISENIRPMQGGGMAGLNRAADNFLKALAG